MAPGAPLGAFLLVRGKVPSKPTAITSPCQPQFLQFQGQLSDRPSWSSLQLGVHVIASVANPYQLLDGIRSASFHFTPSTTHFSTGVYCRPFFLLTIPASLIRSHSFDRRSSISAFSSTALCPASLNLLQFLSRVDRTNERTNERTCQDNTHCTTSVTSTLPSLLPLP